MRQNKVTNLLIALALAVLLFGAGYRLGEYSGSKGKIQRPLYNIKNAELGKTKEIDFGLFWETWNKVEQKFIDQKKLDPQKMFYGAIKGMVAALDDPYTFFLTPEENKQSKEELGGKFEGIGAQLGLRNGRIIIIAPLKNSPAEKAGIRAGDVILEVDGKSTKNWTLVQAVTEIRGEKGTKVTLSLQRADKTLDLEIVRDEIKVASVEVVDEKSKDCKSNCQNVAHIKLNQFGENTNQEWDKVVDEVENKWKTKKIEGVVLDLRDNPGGFLEGSVYVASEFLNIRALVVKQDSTTNQKKEYYVVRKGRLLDIPLSVLINQGSASASEILAGALRDHKRATLIGEKTFGKGSVQEALDLKQGAGLHVTVARWILPNGEWINGKGIEAQVKVENKLEEGNTLTRETDAQLEKAIQQLLK